MRVVSKYLYTGVEDGLTSIGDRNVTVTFIGPTVITYMDRVGVTCTFVTGVVTFGSL